MKRIVHIVAIYQHMTLPYCSFCHIFIPRRYVCLFIPHILVRLFFLPLSFYPKLGFSAHAVFVFFYFFKTFLGVFEGFVLYSIKVFFGVL